MRRAALPDANAGVADVTDAVAGQPSPSLSLSCLKIILIILTGEAD
jgi:hypothetical protein